jgi:hypothetical protein
MAMLPCTAAGCLRAALPTTANSPVPTIVISGFVKVEAQTILLFDNASALESFDIYQCKTIGSDKNTYTKLSKLDGHFARIKVRNLGRTYFDLYYGSTKPAFFRVDGRAIDMWCTDPNLYWAVKAVT